MKVVILTGSQIRHRYYCNYLSKSLDVVGIITEPHSDYFNSQRKNSFVNEHFSKMKMYEEKYLNKYNGYPNCDVRCIPAGRVNDIENIDWAKKLNPDYILLYGAGLLKDEWCNAFKDRIINLHLGLSPRYRGAATLFWTFFNDDLKNLGTTIHLANTIVDGGDILETVKIDMEDGDNYYDTTNKLFMKSVKNIPGVLEAYSKNSIQPKKQDKIKQKFYYKKKDFNEESLRKVLEKYYG